MEASEEMKRGLGNVNCHDKRQVVIRLKALGLLPPVWLGSPICIAMSRLQHLRRYRSQFTGQEKSGLRWPSYRSSRRSMRLG